MQAFAIFGGAGGIVASIGAIIIVGRGVFRQVSATEDNTRAVRELTGRVESLFQLHSNHETRISVLEDRIKR
jgi:hypothetical protein